MDLKRWTIFQKLDPNFIADVKRAYLVGIGGEERGEEVKRLSWSGSVLVMNNEDVYSVMTSGTFGHLLLRGLCNEVTDRLPYVPVKMDALCGQHIRAISSGVGFVTVLTMDGRIYQWGQMMVDTKKKRVLEMKFELVSGNLEMKSVAQVACGAFHTLALSEKGEVYSWGNNCWGQLGTGSRNYAASPTKVSGLNGFDSKITSVACSCAVSLALDSEGNVWSWGQLSNRALGYSVSSGDQLFPRRISLGNIKKIAAGDAHVLALSNANEVYFWGKQGTGTYIVTPLKVSGAQYVVDIGAMLGSSVGAFKTSEGEVYFWGFAYGHAIPGPVVTEFTSITEVFASLDSPMMLEPLEFNGKHSRLDKLRQSFDNSKTGDIIFRVDGKLIYAHKTILKLCGSDRFGRMFGNNEQKAVVEIVDFSYQCFRTYLLYLYTDRIEPPVTSAKDAAELFKLAHDYEEEDLKARCEQQLAALITVSNVSELYALADQQKFHALHDFAVEFMIPNFNAVVKTEGYQKLSRELMIKLTEELSDEGAFVGMKRKRKE